MSPYVTICHHVTKCGHCGSARFDPKTLMPEMGQLQKQLLLCSMGEAPGRREWSWSKGMRAVQTILCSTPSRYPAGVQKYQPLSSTERSKCWAKLQTCLDRVDSQGWLGVVWVLAGLIELRLRHLGRFDFHKANIRLWIPSTQVGLGFRSSRVKLMEYCHVQSWRAVSQLEVSRFEPGAFRSWFFPSHVSGLGLSKSICWPLHGGEFDERLQSCQF